MGKTIKWRRTIGQHDFGHELPDISVMMGKSFGMSLFRVLKQPRGSTLTAPIHGSDGEPPAAQVSDRFEIFFNKLCPALKKADRAKAALGGGIPACKANGK